MKICYSSRLAHSDFFENDFGNWQNFLGLCCWKWFRYIWQVFALCESNFLERHPHIQSVKYSSCFNLLASHFPPSLPPVSLILSPAMLFCLLLPLFTFLPFPPLSHCQLFKSDFDIRRFAVLC